MRPRRRQLRRADRPARPPSQKWARKPTATRPESTSTLFAVSGSSCVGSARRSHWALPETQTVHVGSIRQEMRSAATCASPMDEAYFRYSYEGERVHAPKRWVTFGLMDQRTGAKGKPAPSESPAAALARAVKNTAWVGS